MTFLVEAIAVAAGFSVTARIHELVHLGPQFLNATRSRILEIGDDGALRTVDYDDALPVRTTRAFLADPGRTVRTLLT